MALVDKLAKKIAENPNATVIEVEDVDLDAVKAACAPPTVLVPDFVDVAAAKQLGAPSPPPGCLGFFKGVALIPPQPKSEPPAPDPTAQTP